MKVVILAGGQKSTIDNERGNIPKPMAEIGEKPLLWHIMKSFSTYGFNEFIVCGGYKVDMIKEYLPKERLDIKIKVTGENTRLVILTPHGEEYNSVCEAVI